MTRWRSTVLSDLVSLQRGHDLTEEERTSGEYVVMGSAGANGTHERYIAKGPGVVIGRSGASFGTVHYCRQDYWPHNTVLYVTDFRGNDPRFAYYCLKSVDFNRYNSGSVQQSLNRNYIYSAPVLIPPLREQKAIADILGALDDKIELNRRMNETLEATARSIFKDWFVDFGPTRAKMEGRGPYLEADLWALFPERLDGEGKPENWNRGSIYEIASVVYGAPFASAQFNADGLGEPLIRIRDLPGESPGVWTPEIHPKGYKVRPGDIVVGMDGEFRAYLWGGVEAWLNQRVCVFVPKSGYSAVFVRNSIIEPLAHVEATETATTVIHLGKGDIDRFSAMIPSTHVSAAFSDLCQSWYERIVANKQEVRSLSSMRDLLLPKLMSGEVRVKDAEKVAEGVV